MNTIPTYTRDLRPGDIVERPAPLERRTVSHITPTSYENARGERIHTVHYTEGSGNTCLMDSVWQRVPDQLDVASELNRRVITAAFTDVRLAADRWEPGIDVYSREETS